MPDYQYSKIYKIFSKTSDLVYYGSTTQTVAMRMASHRSHYKKWLKNGKKYTTSFLILEHDDWEYEMVCKCPCNSVQELRRIEGGYIKKNKCVNKMVAGRNAKEHYIDNKEKLKKKAKIYQGKNKEKYKEYGETYRKENKEKLKEQRKIYQGKNKEKIKKQKKIYREKNKEKLKKKHKLYHEKNKDKLNEDQKIYYQKNKEILNLKKLEKIECECGASISRSNICRHKKSKKHLSYFS